METVLARVVRTAADLCQADVAAVTMRTRNPDGLVVLDVFGTGGVIAEKILPTTESLNGMVVTCGHSFRSGDVWCERRPIVRNIALRNRVRSLVIAPFATPDGLTGTLAVGRRAVQDFSARDEGTLENFAHVAGLALRGIRPGPSRRTRALVALGGARGGAVAERRPAAPREPDPSEVARTKVVCLDRYRETGVSADDAPLNSEWDRLARLVEDAWSWRDPETLAAVEAWVSYLTLRLREQWKP